jgi:GTP 3',8-cyclase
MHDDACNTSYPVCGRLASHIHMSIALPVISRLNANTVPPTAPAVVRDGSRLVDAYGRKIRDVRLSVTDRCNYRCIYCMDPDFRYMPKRELLTLDEYLRLVRVLITLGVEKLRITGGEPTLYPDLLPLIRGVGELPLKDVAMTTNGSLMSEHSARTWRDAGLKRITLSLDSTRSERIASITRTKTSLEKTITAIHAAHAAGLRPVKVNAVVMRGVNDDEMPDFAAFASEHDVDMRLIEFMPLDSSRKWSRKDVVTAAEMLEAIRARYELTPVADDAPDSTSMNFTFADGAPGRIGIIAPVTRPFCGECSRLRITADGKVRPCLFSHQEWDVRGLLRDGASDEELARAIIDAVWTKQRGHGIGSDSFIQPQRTMSSIGG